jgi:hypothetical protein
LKKHRLTKKAGRKAVPSHFAKTKTKLNFAFVLAGFATTVPSPFA